ncbi:MAG: conjugal transfer protein TraD [Anaerolineales bacterium]
MAKKQDDWRASRMSYLRALKAPSLHQRLLMQLAEMPAHTPAEARKLTALWAAERASERAQSTIARARRIVTADADAARRARTHRLIQLGALIDLAGMDGWDKGLLLGALLDVRATDKDRHASWKAAGDALLAKS